MVHQVLRTNGDSTVHFEILSNPEFLAEGELLQFAVMLLLYMVDTCSNSTLSILQQILEDL
jgi:hypothetical protein